MSETDLQRAIIKALDQAGYWAFRINSGRFRGAGGYSQGAPAGTPDICVVWPPGWLEVKLPKGTLSQKQEHWKTRARRHGLRVAVVSTVLDALAVVHDWATAPSTPSPGPQEPPGQKPRSRE